MILQEAIYELLGIPYEEQPADCYRLLGLARYESNPDVIRNAAARQVLFVRQLATGRYAEVSQQLIDQLSEARARLLSTSRRRLYDEQLQNDSVAQGASFRNEPTKRMLLPRPPAPESVVETGPCVSPAKREIAAMSEAGAPGVAALKSSSSSSKSRVKASSFRKSFHPAAGAEAPREWVVGVDSSCDVVIRSPYVSRRHCRVWETEGLYWLEDLGSRNGTHINQRRVEGRQQLREGDVVTLGSRARLPWPTQWLSPDEPSSADGAATGEGKGPTVVITIGRGDANDIILHDSSVSRHHAQLMVCGDEVTIEDLGSTNGTFVGESALRVDKRRIGFNETVRFGRLGLPVRQLVEGRLAATKHEQ